MWNKEKKLFRYEDFLYYFHSNNNIFERHHFSDWTYKMGKRKWAKENEKWEILFKIVTVDVDKKKLI